MTFKFQSQCLCLLETKVDNGYISYIKLAINYKTFNYPDIIREKTKFLIANIKIIIFHYLLKVSI